MGEGVDWAAAWPKIAFTSSDVSHVGGELVDCKDNIVDEDIEEEDLSNALPSLFWSLAWKFSDGAKDGIEEEGEIIDKEDDEIFLHISV